MWILIISKSLVSAPCVCVHVQTMCNFIHILYPDINKGV